ncbi:hypothetical protein HELRODRAFT_178541 [Helobdella robusta]|uniref:Uncharacterized protein n=1 Tax=Helobdella robusta TaxID=6412 RepID=T1FDC3_HELRO|nr:hypothetical protein HELRODRAFT_178541 [Helobdella robusta]ESN97092.1 hypothetical protein HELRODRAFT_178541 [Helobdella robusta]
MRINREHRIFYLFDITMDGGIKIFAPSFIPTEDSFCASLSSSVITLNEKLLRRVHLFLPVLVEVDPSPICDYLEDHHILSDEEVRYIEGDVGDSKMMKMTQLVFKLAEKVDGFPYLIMALHENKERHALKALGFDGFIFNQNFTALKKFLEKVVSIDDDNDVPPVKTIRRDENLNIKSILRITNESQNETSFEGKDLSEGAKFQHSLFDSYSDENYDLRADDENEKCDNVPPISQPLQNLFSSG